MNTPKAGIHKDDEKEVDSSSTGEAASIRISKLSIKHGEKLNT